VTRSSNLPVHCHRSGLAVLGPLLLGILLFAGGVRAEEPSLPVETAKALSQAQAAMELKRYAQARAVLDAYLKQHPQDAPAQAYLLLGNAYFREGREEDAWQAYRRGRDLAPEDPSLTRNLAIAAYATERFREAGALFEQVYTEDRKPANLYQSSAAYAKAGEPKKAAAVLDRLLALPGPPEESWLRLALYLSLQTKDAARAEGMLERLLEAEPGRAAYWKMLGRARLDRGDYRGAVEALEIAYDLAGADASELTALADLYLYVNAPLLAAETLKRAYGTTVSPPGCDRLARVFAQARRYDQALAWLDRGLEQAPTASRFFEKGRLLYELGRWAEARAAFESSLSKDPNQGQAHLMLAFIAWEERDWDRTRRALEKASRFKEVRDKAAAMLSALVDRPPRTTLPPVRSGPS